MRRVAVVGAAVTAGAVAGWAAERGWRAAADPAGPDGLTLPEGKERVVTTDDGAELAVTICGSGARKRPTLVLAHGWTNSRTVWGAVARRLVDAGHRVVLYDQRGHGASTEGETPITVDRLGADMATVLEQLDLRDVVIAGHSMGGFTAMAFAAGHPDLLQTRVRGIVLVSTAAHGVGLDGRLNVVSARLAGGGATSWAMARPHLGLFMVRGVVGQRASLAQLEATRDMFVATPPAVRAACVTAFGTMDLRVGLAKVETPTVVLVGTRDTLTPPRLGRAIVDVMPNARFELIRGAGHMLPLEEPDRLAAVIESL
ncbi:MAG TPA: alpha/beta fold hydrolase [Acidimicrobiales bacterium]